MCLIISISKKCDSHAYNRKHILICIKMIYFLFWIKFWCRIIEVFEKSWVMFIGSFKLKLVLSEISIILGTTEFIQHFAECDFQKKSSLCEEFFSSILRILLKRSLSSKNPPKWARFGYALISFPSSSRARILMEAGSSMPM